MTIVCPKCGKVYRIDPARLRRSAVRANCEKCGARIDLAPPQPSEKSGDVPQTRRRTAVLPKRPPDETPTVLEMARQRPPAKDHLAAVVIVAVLLVLAMAVFLVVRDVHRFFSQIVAPALLQTAGQPGSRVPALPRGRNVKKDREALSGSFARRMRNGRDHFKAKRYPQALAAFDGVVRSRPTNADAYYWRGRARLKTDRYDAAIADFKKVLELKPDDTHARDNLGWLYMKRGEYDLSLDYLDASLRLNPDNGWAYYTRGSVHFKRGDHSMAMADAKQACAAGYKKGCRMAAEEKP